MTAERLAADLRSVIDRAFRSTKSAEDALVLADAAVTLVTGPIATELRELRARAVLELRSPPDGWTWPAIGELLDVSGPRAEQYARQAEPRT